jgi:hypothetical protein
VEDPVVWNHFQAEGRLRNDFDGLDIHISCRVPDDPELARKSFFYIDDVSLQAVEEPPLTVSTPLDEYYIGETIPWSVTSATSTGQIKIALLAGDRVIVEQTRNAEIGSLCGTFDGGKLQPGIYTVRATIGSPQAPLHTAPRQIIVCPDPFAW